jgi:hypothetical protein
MRGVFLNCRFAVKGIQKAFRSFGAGLRSSAIAASSGQRGRAATRPASAAVDLVFDRMVRITLAEVQRV